MVVFGGVSPGQMSDGKSPTFLLLSRQRTIMPLPVNRGIMCIASPSLSSHVAKLTMHYMAVLTHDKWPFPAIGLSWKRLWAVFTSPLYDRGVAYNGHRTKVVNKITLLISDTFTISVRKTTHGAARSLRGLAFRCSAGYGVNVALTAAANAAAVSLIITRLSSSVTCTLRNRAEL